MKLDSRKQPVRYLMIGGMCAIANNILLIVGSFAGLNVLELTILSFLIIGTLAYITHVRFTFRQLPGFVSYGRFMAGVAIGIPAAYLALTFLCDVLRFPMIIAAPAATFVLLVYNFLSAKLAITRRLFG